MLEKEGQVQNTEPSTSSDSTLTTTRTNIRNKKSKRRFSEAQIKCLEAVFETEPKLEANAKVQLAKELHLQPQQIETWFQNKRARLKSKKLERDYCLLKAKYIALATKLESINKEKEMLLMQLRRIVHLGPNPDEESKASTFSTGGDIDSQYLCVSYEESDFRMPIYSDDEKNHNMCFGEAQESDLVTAMDQANQISALTFDSNNSLFDKSCGTSLWSEFWS